MIRLSMYVMLSTWKQLVKHASKKKKPPVVLSGYSKNQDLTMFFVRIGRVFSGSRFRFLSDLDGFFRTWISDSTLVFLRIWTGFFGLGFRTRPWFFFGFGAAFSDLDFGLDLGFSSDLERLFRTWISDSTFGFSSDLEQLFCRIGYFKSIKTV